MSRIYRDLKIDLDEDLDEKLKWMAPSYSSYRILRKSVDARRSSAPHWVYSVEIFEQDEKPSEERFELDRVPPPRDTEKPLIVGSGPAGLFAALRLCERGIPCTLIERGSVGEKRIQSINRFWRYGELDPNNNVCIGEGGAGLYSDGKLITRIKSPFIPYVMDRLIQFGAPSEIRYLANPHVGSDRIRRVIPKMRSFLQANGCEMHFDMPMEKLLIESGRVTGVKTKSGREFRSNQVVLATGHSAEDVLEHLCEIGVQVEGKSFALGLRIEHPQTEINRIQFRQHAENKKLGAANYRLASHDNQTGIGVYSFCMCPGGYVLSSGTEGGGVVANGMSNYHRNSPFANAAIVVAIDHGKRFGSDVFGGLKFRRELEKAAFNQVTQANGGAVSHHLPVQRVVDFLDRKKGEALKSSSPSGVTATRLDEILPTDVYAKLCEGLLKFDKNMKGFISPDAQFHGVESRTSCPVRVVRDSESLQSVSHPGLYPTGEGAGYAGGITSAACDGIRVAEAIASTYASRALLP